MEKKLRSSVADYIYMVSGTFILAFALNVFLVPIKLSIGGISGIGTAFLYFFKVPLWVTNFVLNGLLFIIGYKFLGKTSLFKTIGGIIFLSMFLGITENIRIELNDVWLYTLTGGAVAGLGIGLTVSRGASTGGSDFGALILNKKFPYISVTKLILFIDCVIIIIMGIVFQSLIITIYSLVSLAVTCKVADMVMNVGERAKAVYIISEKNNEIAEIIMNEFDRGVTGVHSRGMYKRNNSLMLISVISPKELSKLVERIKHIDENVFLIVSEAHEVMGNGFKMIN